MFESWYDPPEPRRLPKSDVISRTISLPWPYVGDECPEEMEFEADVVFDEGSVYEVILTTEYRYVGYDHERGNMIEIIDMPHVVVPRDSLPQTLISQCEEAYLEILAEDAYEH